MYFMFAVGIVLFIWGLLPMLPLDDEEAQIYCDFELGPTPMFFMTIGGLIMVGVGLSMAIKYFMGS